MELAKRWAHRKAPSRREASHVRHTTESVVQLDKKEREPQTFGEHLAERITALFGSLLFVGIHLIWFGAWIGWNSDFSSLPKFDEYPFTFLTFVVSLEAIFLSTFVLMSENRQSVRAERRALVDLEVNVLSERELTKILELVADIHRQVAQGEPDAEVQEMISTVRLDDIEKSMEEAESRLDGNK